MPTGGGGVHGSPQRKPPSQRNFVMKTTLYVYTLKTIIFKQGQNIVSNSRFFACVISILAKNLKTKQSKTKKKQKNKKTKKQKQKTKNKKKNKKTKTFSEEFFHWILDHCRRVWIHLHCWSKIWKFLFMCHFRGNFFLHSQNANLC